MLCEWSVEVVVEEDGIVLRAQCHALYTFFIVTLMPLQKRTEAKFVVSAVYPSDVGVCGAKLLVRPVRPPAVWCTKFTQV